MHEAAKIAYPLEHRIDLILRYPVVDEVDESD